MAELRPSRHQTRSGMTFFIRFAQGKDAQSVLDNAREVLAEEAYSLTSVGEFQVSLQEEIDHLEAYRKDPHSLFLVAQLEDGRIVGTLDFAPGHRQRIAHAGEFGMGVAAECRREGIGQALLAQLLSWAWESSPIEKINLTVHADNLAAIGLYRKMGFEIEGVRKRELRYPDGRYGDVVLMAYFVDRCH